MVSSWVLCGVIMAADFSYTSVPNSLRQFLKGVPNRGVPAKVSADHLKSIGLKETNDQSIIRVLKFVGLLNSDGSPNDAYKEFRDKSKGPGLLAKEIRRAYKELFDTYPDAQTQTDENLRNFFNAKTGVGQKAVSYILATFKVLCEFGDFSGTQVASLGAGPVGHAASGGGQGVGPGRGNAPEVHINLQIHLPDAASAATYDAIFEAMARRFGKLI